MSTDCRIFVLDNDFQLTSKRRRFLAIFLNLKMILRNVLSQFFIVKCFSKSLLVRKTPYKDVYLSGLISGTYTDFSLNAAFA